MALHPLDFDASASIRVKREYSSTHKVALWFLCSGSRIPIIIDVWIIARVSALSDIILSLIAIWRCVVLRMTFHVLDWDAYTIFSVNLVNCYTEEITCSDH